MSTKKTEIDSLLTYIILKKFMKPIEETEAYKKGFVDESGKIIKSPENEEDKHSFTLLDKLVFKIKRMLGTKITHLYNFLYINTINNDFYNRLIVKGNVSARPEIHRIRKNLKEFLEKNNCSFEELVEMEIKEEVKRI